jgi:hypothetical protein
MRPADDLSPGQLVGKRVAFKEGEDHERCWHTRNGVKTGVVLRLCPTLAQKAELLGPEGFPHPEALPDEDEEPRLWVRADPCASYPHGCEVGVDKECLLVAEGPGSGAAPN